MVTSGRNFSGNKWQEISGEKWQEISGEKWQEISGDKWQETGGDKWQEFGGDKGQGISGDRILVVMPALRLARYELRKSTTRSPDYDWQHTFYLYLIAWLTDMGHLVNFISASKIVRVVSILIFDLFLSCVACILLLHSV